MKQSKIIQATQVDGKNIADIFKLSCVTSIRKSFPGDIYATVFCYDGKKRVVRKGDWIVQGFNNKSLGWYVLTNEEYKKKMCNP